MSDMPWKRAILLTFLAVLSAQGERINHEGRILGALVSVTNATLFNTAQADAIVSTMQIFPPDHAWNENISGRPLLSNSAAMMAQIVSDLATNRRTLRVFQEMNFALVPTNQPLVPITFDTYPGDSDPSPYPFPANTPIEGWPSQTGGLSLFDWQRDINGSGGDRHAIVVQPETGFAWETWSTDLVITNGGTNWTAANGAKWNLNSNGLRPAGWTSADAAGLSMFGGLVRYDECQRGTVEHAIRLVVKRTRKAYVYPATHYASVTNSPDLPAMGQRLRLKPNFQIPATWSKEEKAILTALMKYGAIVADNGGFFSISAVPDDRWSGSAFSHLSSVSVTNFEVIQSTGAGEGPRSPGAPKVSAGLDTTAFVGVPISLAGMLSYTNAAPITNTWSLYSGPGHVLFSDVHRTNSTATFDAAGVYTLMLNADDGIHTPAYDAVVVTALNGIKVNLRRNGNSVLMDWQGGQPPYTIEETSNVTAGQWQTLISTNGTNLSLAAQALGKFYRVRGW